MVKTNLGWEIGKYIGNKNFERRGIAKRATESLIFFISEEFKFISKIYSKTKIKNFTNIKLNEILGFRKERILDEEFLLMKKIFIMCGFVCLVKRDFKKDKFISNNLLKHRGPDFTEEINYKSVSIRHWRLSIVDLSEKSNQPLEKQNYIFAYNGEIYNYQDISNKFFKKLIQVILIFFLNY